ncbi:MAG: hypothetical protein EBU54_14290, partial [Mycobacteriaceae bacterium]|nr:hypothetical protein [Mycobacteriaceae bacterium]
MLVTESLAGLDVGGAVVWGATAFVSLYLLITVRTLRILFGTMSVVLIALGGGVFTGVTVNLFGAAGSITPEMLSYLSIPTFTTTSVKQQVMNLSANGDVAALKSPLAKNPLSLAVGFENRKVIGANQSDAVIQTQGELLGSGAPIPDRKGELKFNEYYVEGSLPLVQDRP